MSSAPTFRNLPRTLQELPPEQARLCLNAERFVREDIGLTDASLRGQSILVACSGGCDSTALLLILHYLSPRLGCSITVAHLDHCLRAESPEEARYVQSLSAALGLTCTVERTDIKAHAAEQNIGIEEAARKARYAFLEATRHQQGCQYIATAHHLNDLAEDVLMRLVRGTGWPALGGMTAYCTERKLIRPLLVTERNKLESFLRAFSITWCEDASNSDPTYFRNRIRSDFMPLFLRENPSFLSSVAGLWRHARIDADHWKTEENNILGLQNKITSSRECLTEGMDYHLPQNSPADTSSNAASTLESTVTLTREQLKTASKAMRLRLYKRCLDSLGTGQSLLENLQGLDRAWIQNEGGKIIQFPGGKTATITSGNILFKCV